MDINDKISVGDLKIRPYDSTSKIASEIPGAELFDNRNHFILFAHQTHVAVYMSIINKLALKSTSRGVKVGILAVTLRDIDDDDRAVGARNIVNFAMSRSEFMRYERLDVYVPATDINPYHRYRVTVEAGRMELESREIRFFALKELRLPTKWYSPLKGSVLIGWPEYYGVASPGSGLGNEAVVEFQLENMLPVEIHSLPEVEIALIRPDGVEERQLLIPSRLSADDDDRKLLSVRWSFDINHEVKGVYCACLRCMTYVFATFLFSNEGAVVENPWTAEELKQRTVTDASMFGRAFGDMVEKHGSVPDEMPDTTEEAPDGNKAPGLDDLVGLASLQQRMAQYTALVRFNRLREDAGFSSLSLPLHSMFLGSPGTGKTTVAKILGSKLRELGVLSKGHVVVRERATLIGKYYSSESENTLAAIEEAEGGILFIDEAYQLCQPDDPKDPGRFVIETLMTALADESKRDWMLILAGYTEPMQRLFDINPGLRSRIPQSNIFTFEDFNGPELMEIAEGYLRRNHFTLDEQARHRLCRRLSADYANRDADFGNARHVINLITTSIIPAVASRVSQLSDPDKEQLTTILPADIPADVPQPTYLRAYRRIGFAV